MKDVLENCRLKRLFLNAAQLELLKDGACVLQVRDQKFVKVLTRKQEIKKKLEKKNGCERVVHGNLKQTRQGVNLCVKSLWSYLVI